MKKNMKQAFIRKLYEKNIIQFGAFTLKSGLASPFYVDMRKVISYPSLVEDLVTLMQEEVNVEADHVCAVPYGAIPVAVAYALRKKKPSLLLRKQRKAYGKGKQLEGVFEKGDSVLLLEDVIVSGESIVDSIQKVQEESLTLQHIVVFVDREQGGMDYLKRKGYSAQAILTITEMVEALHDKLTSEQQHSILSFIQEHDQTAAVLETSEEVPISSIHPKALELLQKAKLKKSNLILSADSLTLDNLWTITKQCAFHIIGLKLHAESIAGFNLKEAMALKAFSEEHDFLLIEDRKFADIGSTHLQQMDADLLGIGKWADMITTHFIAGMEALRVFKTYPLIGLIGIVEMSSEGTMATGVYSDQCVELMREEPSLFVGAVCQDVKLPTPYIQFMSGIHLDKQSDGKGQRYRKPGKETQSDFFIVGRGIYQNDDPQNMAKHYQQLLWDSRRETLS